nr:hypothetical protein [Tanacetum cinerariifolium]
MKEDVGNVSVWVKLHGVPVTAFSEDGLSPIATKLGTHLMLDSNTFDMCIQSWSRSSYARALIEIRADTKLKDTIVVAMPKLVKEGFYTCTIRVEPVAKKTNANTSGNKKKDVEPTKDVSNSNPFDVLNSVENDVDLDDEGKLLEKIDSSGDHDSEDEIESIDNEIENFLALEKVGHEDSKPILSVGMVWSGKYMDDGLTKSMKELDNYYTMLEELHSVIICGALIHKSHRGVPLIIKKFYKPRVLCVVEEVVECHISFRKPWRQEVKRMYDLQKKSLSFLMKRKKNCYDSPKGKPILPTLEVKVEEKMLKVKVVEKHVEKIQNLQIVNKHVNEISTSVLKTTKEVGVLKTCDEEVAGYWWEYGRRVKKYEGYRVDVKHKSTKDKVRHERVFGVDEAIDSEYLSASSFQVRGNDRRYKHETCNSMIALGNEDSFSFWEDKWYAGGVIKELFPRLYALELHKHATVSMKLMAPSLDNSFRRRVLESEKWS